MGPEQFWNENEEKVNNFDEFEQLINDVFVKGPQRNRVFAWRGHADASWPLHSLLYRRLYWTSKRLPEERDLYRQEGLILADLHRWGLHMTSGLGRLSVLNQLATLQHYGAPTRLIDVSFNPWIGTWFAVEEKRENGITVNEDVDGRVFAIDVTNRLINEHDEYRKWEDELQRPWRVGQPLSKPTKEQKIEYRKWCTKVFAWRPPHFDNRIAAQNGGFVMGGVPISSGPEGPNQWPRAEGTWKIKEVRESTSLSLRPNMLKAKRGPISQDAIYTIRITAQAKQEIRERLENLFGYEHRTIYPDYPGFAEFGTPALKRHP